MSRPRLVSDLYGSLVNRVVLVVGGGPSAPGQYREVISLIHNPVVVSANDHAFKLGLTPSFIFCKDHYHTETKEAMLVRLGQYGVPLVTPQWWGSFRCAQWPIQGHSGFQAIAFATLMQPACVIPIGMDCFQNGTYFHDLTQQNVSGGRREGYWHRKIDVLAEHLAGAVVRPVGGPFTRAFRQLNPLEQLPVARVPVKFEKYADMPTCYVRATRKFVLPHDAKAMVPVGAIIPVTEGERLQFVRGNVAEPVDDC